MNPIFSLLAPIQFSHFAVALSTVSLSSIRQWMSIDTMVDLILIIMLLVLIQIIVFKNRKLKKTNERLLKEEIRYRNVVEDQVELICRIRLDTTFSFVNTAFCRNLAKIPEDLLDISYCNFLSEKEIPEMKVRFDSITSENPSIRFDYPYVNPEGKQFWYEWTIRGLFDENGGLYEYQSIGRDITHMKETEELLIQLKEEAETASRTKSEFLARMSHELRTPLNSVIGFASILLKNKNHNLSGKEINYLERIKHNGNHLLILINQILDIAKIESGRMEIEIKSVHLEQLIGEIIEQMEEQVQQKNIQLKSDIPKNIAPIETDENKMRQILFNLIGNAVKFTSQGSITIHVAIHPQSHIPVHLDVIDTGIGIPPQRITAIFEPFQQADMTTSTRFGGTGLGLSISKSLCDLLGYTIQVQSEEGKGSHFSVVFNTSSSVSIPERAITIPERKRKTETSEQEENETLRLPGKTVLIIDDQQDARILLQHIVEEFGCKAITATNGKEGLELAAQFHPDFITLDVLLPEMNGWEVLIALKSDPALNPIPVIVISIVASDLRTVSMGLVDLMQKPINPDELRALMQRRLREKTNA